MKKLLTRIIQILLVLIISIIMTNIVKAEAVEAVEIKVSASDESDTSLLMDDYVSTRNTYNAGDVITVNTEIPIKSLYIKWNSKPGEWTLTYNGSTATYGNYNFLHEYCELATLTTSLTITINTDGVELCGIQAFPEGEVPEYVQKWEPPCDKADILLFTAHADDEQLYMGAIAPIYAAEKGMKVQYVYFTDHSLTSWNYIREHEKLNGLWAVGVKYYPITGDFYDVDLSGVPKTATKEEVFQFASPLDMEKVHSFLVEQIRRFEPLVIISHDIYGEYGHGTHRVIAYSLMEDVIAANDASKYMGSVNTYGTWDTPKLYLHLYSENVIDLEVNTPLEVFDGKTALDMAKIGYQYHESQVNTCWFYVSDTNEYTITKYGLVRSTVGVDVAKNDIFENLYENPNYSVKIEEARLAAIEAARLEEESRKQAESESISLSIASEEAESLEQLQEEKGKKTFKKIIIIVIIAAIVVIAVIVVLIVLKSNRRKRRGYRHYHK